MAKRYKRNKDLVHIAVVNALARHRERMIVIGHIAREAAKRQQEKKENRKLYEETKASYELVEEEET